jgi:acylphosphatase
MSPPEDEKPAPQPAGGSGLARVRLQVRGEVQGVGFRYAAVREATRLGLRGWVRNRWDDSVELVAEGSREDLEALLAWCRVGPRLARVHRVEEEWETPEGVDAGFQVRATR